VFIRTLLNGLTTIFAWTPASVLVVIATYGLYAGLINIIDVHWSITIGLLLIGIGGIAGYIGMTAIAWNIQRITTKAKVVCLGLGVLTLIAVVVIGALSDSEVLYLGLYWVDLYLFVSPLLFGIGHLVHQILVLKKEVNPSELSSD
jgi:hypothetical protein